MYPSIVSLEFGKWIDSLLLSLRGCFAAIVDGRSNADDEFDGWIDLIRSADDPAIDEPVGIIKLLFSAMGVDLKDDQAGKMRGGSAMVALVYVWRAGVANEEGDRDRAWPYLCAGAYWAGYAKSGSVVDDLQKLERKSQAALAAHAKAGKYAPLKEYARKIVDGRLGPGRKWPSVLNAAETIFAEVEAYRKYAGLPVSPISQRTLEDWLAKMPEAADVFENRRKK